jgi:hypothetical protein
MKPEWRIAEASANWECTWTDNERFRERVFRELPPEEKIRVIEGLCEVVDFFRQKRVPGNRDGEWYSNVNEGV